MLGSQVFYLFLVGVNNKDELGYVNEQTGTQLGKQENADRYHFILAGQMSVLVEALVKIHNYTFCPWRAPAMQASILICFLSTYFFTQMTFTFNLANKKRTEMPSL